MRLRPILVGVDFSPAADVALHRAFQLARQRQVPVRCVHSIPENASEIVEWRSERRVAAHVETLSADWPGVHAVPEVVRGRPVPGLLAAAAACRAQLIVLGGHGKMRWRDGILGTTAENLIVETHWPVLIARQPVQGAYRRVLAAIDGAGSSAEILALACGLHPEALLAIHAFDASRFPANGTDPRSKALEDVATAVNGALDGRASRPAEVQLLAEEGEVGAVVRRAWAEHAPDLLVIGTHGRSGLDRMIRGSRAEELIESLPHDMLVLRRNGG